VGRILFRMPCETLLPTVTMVSAIWALPGGSLLTEVIFSGGRGCAVESIQYLDFADRRASSFLRADLALINLIRPSTVIDPRIQLYGNAMTAATTAPIDAAPSVTGRACS
jgi:hypothetical protein